MDTSDKSKTNVLVFIVEKIIRLYQKTISPDHGILSWRYPYGACRYYPSCSEYSRQAFIKFGFFKGMYLTIKRLIRCHPWSKGGHDPVIK